MSQLYTDQKKCPLQNIIFSKKKNHTKNIFHNQYHFL